MASSFLKWIDDEEISILIKAMDKEDSFLTNRAFLNRVRTLERNKTHCSSILNTMVWRFDPPSSIYQQIEQTLGKINDEKTLNLLLKAAIQTKTIDDFQEAIKNSAIQQQAMMEPKI